MMPPDEPAERKRDADRLSRAGISRPPLMLARPRVKPGDPAADAVVAALRGAVMRIAASDPEASRGDAEGVHRLRTATRRLRSELRAFEELIDSDWHNRINLEMKWLAGLLGDVRDLDILIGRLRKDACAANAPDEQALRRLFPVLEARHQAASTALKDALQSDRYRSLLLLLKNSIAHPELRDSAHQPCESALPPLAAAAWRRLTKRARDLRRSDPDDEFHDVRKRAKRARYTAELVAPILGRRIARSADRFIRLATQVQDILGEFHDAIVTAEELNRALARCQDDRPFQAAAERLVHAEEEAARAARAAFFGVWRKLDRKKSTRWLKIGTKARAR
jgi:CHAD domain-containing protein